ncbi:hypothetical protein PGUG_01841 [Meyerozyma guilliermondii ATCC 6260]|uniref:RGS domain-containing protein n=1 Tax=Meyerozyma guilliermondii (strain ATCC 6260 / CBS 566 / DSM 6381 / JCM 1539 / NBRC 10279 / NRRL Y-324) TaxID=294746 RepID=A5DEZ0_PICGU|nr:uncharacterized protein PGUG_01841 [Meyerozyma guilliermondii ATCC 6260]EDK37743.2 hypothetical protein PGUG_01841 [Meyerozyma guilliermondii ATCC 6260]
MVLSGTDHVMSPVPYKAVPLAERFRLEDDTENLGTCKLENSPKECTVSNCCKVPSLDQLIDDCFRYSIGELHDQKKIDRVESFKKIVVQLHCEENLAFMIDIYKYEYFYAKIYPQTIQDYIESTSSNKLSPKPAFLNRSLSTSIDDLPHPSKIDKNLFHKRVPSSTVMSVQSDELVPTSVFVSSIDDLHPAKDLHSTWDTLRDKSTEEESLDDGIDQDSTSENEDARLLTNQWNHIIFTYVHHDAPLQINLSNMSYQEIIDADKADSGPVSPSALLRAQHEILQLIKENAYIPFINLNRESKSVEESPPSCPSSAPSCFLSTDSTNPRSPQISARGLDSPVLSPTPSNSRYKQKKNRFIPFSSPQLESSSTSSSASSITNFFNHLKLHSPTSSRSHTPAMGSPPSTASSPVSVPHSANSVTRKVAAQDVGRTQSLKLNKLWKKKP